MLSLMQSSQEDVQERAATSLATFVVIDDENASIDSGRAEAVMQNSGIRLLLNIARSWREGLQSEAAKVTFTRKHCDSDHLIMFYLIIFTF